MKKKIVIIWGLFWGDKLELWLTPSVKLLLFICFFQNDFLSYCRNIYRFKDVLSIEIFIFFFKKCVIVNLFIAVFLFRSVQFSLFLQYNTLQYNTQKHVWYRNKTIVNKWWRLVETPKTPKTNYRFLWVYVCLQYSVSWNLKKHVLNIF